MKMSLLCSYEFLSSQWEFWLLVTSRMLMLIHIIYLMAFASSQNSLELTIKVVRMQTEEKLSYHIVYK